MMKNTIIVYTSDHGELLGNHGLKGKAGNMYDNNFHVPLVIYHPEYSGGRVCSHVTSHLDLAPTFVDMALDDENMINDVKDGIKGFSLMPAVENPDVDVRDNQGVLFVYDMISMMDKDMISIPISESKVDIRVDLEKRGYLRGVITEDYKFILPDYNNMEIKMEPLPKAVYMLFLNHPEGIRFKDLPCYREELARIYLNVTNRNDFYAAYQSILNVTDPTKNSINEKCSRIKEAFISRFDDKLSSHYYITGLAGEKKGVRLSRRLIMQRVGLR